MVEHTLRAYDEELEGLTAELSRMGGLAESGGRRRRRAPSPAATWRWPRP